MEKVFTKFTVLSILFLLFVSITFAQAPQASTYQAVARDGSGNILQNQSIGLRFSVLQGSSSGTLVYKETQTTSTNSLGIFSVNVGQGTVVTGTFNGITWASGTYYLEVEMDPTGGTSYTEMGTPQQMMSVPYALNAANGVPASTGATQPQYLATTTTGGTPVFRNPVNKFVSTFNYSGTINNNGTCYWGGPNGASGVAGLPNTAQGNLSPYIVNVGSMNPYFNYTVTSACNVNAISGWLQNTTNSSPGTIYLYMWKLTPGSPITAATQIGFTEVASGSVAITTTSVYNFNLTLTSNVSLNPGDVLLFSLTPSASVSAAMRVVGTIEFTTNVQ